VQITAAPLWPLFRHKPWQKVLKDTWAKLEKGDYDWAHLAMNYWPEPAFARSARPTNHWPSPTTWKTLYVEPEAKPKKTRGKKSPGTVTQHLLDGQQRLTAFWRSIHNNYEWETFFVYLPQFDRVREQIRLGGGNSLHPPLDK
jgi:hypothetical protein